MCDNKVYKSNLEFRVKADPITAWQTLVSY